MGGGRGSSGGGGGFAFRRVDTAPGGPLAAPLMAWPSTGPFVAPAVVDVSMRWRLVSLLLPSMILFNGGVLPGVKPKKS